MGPNNRPVPLAAFPEVKQWKQVRINVLQTTLSQSCRSSFDLSEGTLWSPFAWGVLVALLSHILYQPGFQEELVLNQYGQSEEHSTGDCHGKEVTSHHIPVQRVG